MGREDGGRDVRLFHGVGKVLRQGMLFLRQDRSVGPCSVLLCGSNIQLVNVPIYHILSEILIKQMPANITSVLLLLGTVMHYIIHQQDAKHLTYNLKM